MRALVWLRSDLRLHDHPALHAACERAERGVIAVFLLAAEQWEEHDWGAPKRGFVLRNLLDLAPRLEKLGIPLRIADAPRFDDAPDILLELAERHGCDALFFHRELEVNEARRDRQVARRFEEAGRSVHRFDDQTILAPGCVKTLAGDFYSVFSPYHRAWLKQLEEVGGPSLVGPPKPQAEAACKPSRLDGVRALLPASGDREDLWAAGEEAAEQRLERFLASVARRYHDARDTPAEPSTSTLSPYLAVGAISPRAALAAAIAANHGRLDGGGRGISSWMRQLVWRDFYRHVLVGFPRVSKHRAFKSDTEGMEWNRDAAALVAWQEGRSGFPIVDAGMRQLLQTGWMHNRLRMITAMFLTKDLLIDWRKGERFFMRRLVDADLANNNGGWQWSASTGTDAAPYFRIMNPWTQGKRFDAEGRYIRRFLPELAGLDAKHLHGDAPASVAARRACGYPEPIVDHGAARARAIALFKGGRG